ncbi:MAG: phosphotransferase [Actinomycetota bacterium]
MTDASAVEAVIGVAVTSLTETVGGFTSARTYRALLDDGRTVFAKIATDDAGRETIALEARALRLGAAPMPRLFGADSPGGVLVTEWLDAEWSPPLHEPTPLWVSIDALAELDPPEELFLVFQGAGREWWSDVVAVDHDRLDLPWIRRHVEVLRTASLAADTSGDRLLHGDLGPGNWCHDHARRWRFVDWGAAHRGNPLVDHTIASIRVGRSTGSPTPTPRLRARPEFAAFVTGRMVAETVETDWSGTPPHALTDRLDDIDAGLRLCAVLFDLEPPALRGRR